MQIVIKKGDQPNQIDVNNLNDNQKPGYLNLRLKLRLIDRYPNLSKDLVNDAIDKIDLAPFISAHNADQKMLLFNIIKYQLMIRGVDIDISELTEKLNDII